MTASVLARAAAGLVAVASVVPMGLGALLALLSALYALERPDPAVPDGDPCCGYPDTWGDVAAHATLAAGTLAGCLALGYVAARLAVFAWAGRAPTRGERRRGAIAAACVLLWLGVIVVAGSA